MEVRRGARVATTFLVAIEALEDAPERRKGDISATGVYFETDKEVGNAGTIHWLHLVSADGERKVRVMAYVVRTVRLASPGGLVGGAAFEFMPESDDSAAMLHDFVRYVLALRHPGGIDPHIPSRLAAQASGVDRAARSADAPSPDQAASRAATVRKLSVRSMVLETSWAIEPGESVRVDIVAPGMTRRIRLDGRAVRVAPIEPSVGKRGYMIEVEVDEETEGPLRRPSSMSFPRVRPEEMAQVAQAAARRPVAPVLRGKDRDQDEGSEVLEDLLSALIMPRDDDGLRKRAHHLSGQLSRVRLPTLCSLFEMESLTGELVVRRGGEEVRIFLDRGKFVDAEPLRRGETARARLRSTLGWDEGSFEFYVQPVNRPDRIGMSTTALLLDLAREEDEAKRDSRG